MAFILISCGVSKDRYVDKSYVFADQPKRNLELLFRRDNTFTLINRVKGSLVFSVTGSWEKLPGRKLLLIHDGSCSDSETSKVAAKGEPIDIMSAYNDKGYIFPCIQSDTAYFSENMRSVILNGFKFE